MKRALDFLLATPVALALLPLLLLLGVLVRLTSKGPALHWSVRVGKDGRLFRMPKLRSMRAGTPLVATHLLDDPRSRRTPIGAFLRITSLDELPQLWSVLRGDMSLVGPRPALPDQKDLLALRSATGVNALVPGITGWAQVNGRDDLPVARKAALDAQYLAARGLRLDLRILWMTAGRVLGRQGVSH
ncbi:MAG TPA: sugar transferase [Fibrobacteria bacterium]|nr:sugar transferase [Fibrobacteria bacterium]